MALVSRTAVLALVAGVVLLAAGCSNNKGKIQGKWKTTGDQIGAPGAPADAGLFFEFNADNTFRAYVSAAGATIELTKGKYSLGTGDWVHLNDLSPPMDGKTRSKEKITINGDNMTLAGEGGKTMTFTRVK